MLKKCLISLFFLVGFSMNAFAQTGFNPEFMGNGAPGPYGGFCLKSFSSYFNQEGIKAHDLGLALQPQYFSEGFSGADRKDQFLFLAHIPGGYRTEETSGQRNSVVGVGTVSMNIHHFFRLRDNPSNALWFDNGLSFGLPTATQQDGLRMGGNAYSIGWYQELFWKPGEWLISTVPVSTSWSFRDQKSDERGGLSLSLANSSAGRKLLPWLFVGANGGLAIGRVAGSEDLAGNELPTTFRAYAGPAAAVEIRKNLFLQVGSAIDIATQNTDRGQGIFLALWHHIL